MSSVNPSNSTDAAEYQNRTYPLPRGSKRQANSMSFIKLLTPMPFHTCVSIRDLAGGKTGSKRGHGGMPGSFDKEPAP
jgi:hypothetical protein